MQTSVTECRLRVRWAPITMLLSASSATHEIRLRAASSPWPNCLSFLRGGQTQPETEGGQPSRDSASTADCAVADELRPPRQREPIFTNLSGLGQSLSTNTQHSTLIYVLSYDQFATRIMVMGRLFHYAIDAVLLSTVLAGVRRSSGLTYVHYLHSALADPYAYLLTCSPQTDTITDPTMRSLTDRYLGIGETVLDMIQATASGSQYFKRDIKP